MKKHRILAITLARGGSKSIRKKYIQDQWKTTFILYNQRSKKKQTNHKILSFY